MTNMSSANREPFRHKRSAWVVALFVGLILAAGGATYMGYLPLTPKNDAMRSLQR